MPASDKRARKKQARDAALATRRAQLKRRRLARLIGVGVVLGTIVVVAIASGNDDSGPPEATPTPSPEGAACGADPPPPASPGTYDGPEQVLQKGVDYSAVVHTSCGDLEIDLLEDDAPISVNNFIFLAREGFYDGLIWHRVEGDSVIQTGDPNGQNNEEPNGPGYSIEDELPEKASEYVYGVVGMANSGAGTGGSQWFIVVHKGGPAGFPPSYSIFGDVARPSYEVLETIRKLPTKGGNDPVEAVKPIVPVYIETIDIVEN